MLNSANELHRHFHFLCFHPVHVNASPSPRLKIIHAIVALVLAIVTVYQIGLNYQPAVRDLMRIRANIGRDGLWRSAYFHRNLRFASFVDFLLANIPAGARVVLLPAEGSANLLDNTPIMQFFLAPRHVFNCTEDSCLSNINAANTVMVLNSAAQQAGLPAGARVLGFDEGWSLALLDPTISPSGTRLPVYESLAAFAGSLALPLLWLVLLSASGALIVRGTLPDLQASLLLALGSGFSLGALTLGLALGWMVGLPLASATVVLLSLGLISWAGVSLARWRPGLSGMWVGWSRRMDPWLVGIIVLGAVSLVLSIGRGFSATDEVLLWGAKGRGLAATGDLGQITGWGTNTVSYPFHIPVLIAAGELIFMDGLAAYKIIPPLYAMSLALLMYGFLLRWGTRRALAGLATLAVLTSPLWFRHATLAYANLPLVYALAAAGLLLVDGFAAPDKPGRQRQLLLSGGFYVFAAWTRPEGWILGLSMIAAVWAAAYWKRPQPDALKERVQRLAWLAAPLLVYGIFWSLLQAFAYAGFTNKSNLIPAALAALAKGNLHEDALVYLLRSFFERLFSTSSWGLWGFALVLCLAVGLARSGRSFRVAALGLAGVLSSAAVMGMYYVTSYDPVKDLSWWVSSGLDRMLMPGFLLLWLAGMAGISGDGPDGGGKPT